LAKAFLFFPQKLSLGRAAVTATIVEWLVGGRRQSSHSTPPKMGSKGANDHEYLHRESIGSVVVLA
jgi:hypothetical protein